MWIVYILRKCKRGQTVSNSYPSVFPDYTFTAIPYNIAPLNFEVKGAQEIRADFAGEGVNLLTVRVSMRFVSRRKSGRKC